MAAAATNQPLTVVLLPGTLAVCRLAALDHVPAWAMQGAFYSITRTPEELSLVVDEAAVPAAVRCEGGWACLKVAGPLDFALTGVLAALTAPLAAAGISVFAIATYDTDYLLVRHARLSDAVSALRAAGHNVESGGEGTA